MMIDTFSLQGKSGIVTGGGTGLGKGMATAVVRAGAEVLIVGRRRGVLEKTADELKKYGGSVVPFPADLSKMENIPGVVEKAIKDFGKIDFLINNAAITRRAPCEEYSEADWDIVMQTNLKSPFFLAQAVAKTMIAAKRPGAIVNIASIVSFVGGTNVPSYAASKGGINQVTKSLANGWARYGIRVNAIGPGWFNTDLTEAIQQDRERYKDITQRIPLGRWGNPEELGGVAVFLASDASSYITGQTIVVDGGWLSN